MSLVALNKKGAVTDAIYVPIYILGVVMTIFVCLYAWTQFQQQMLITTASSAANQTINQTMIEFRQAFVLIDPMIIFMVGGLLIVSLVFAFKTGANILYAFVSIILWAIAMMMSAVFTNIFEEFATHFPSISAELPVIVFIMANMKWIVLAWLFLLSIVMFTRTQKEDTELKQLTASEAIYDR